MAKKVTGSVKLQIEAAKATPAPPVGPALGQAQVNIMEFCKQFNAKTQNKELAGLIIPVVITVYSDRTFTFITKTPPAAVSAEARRRHREGFRRAEQGQGRQGDREAGDGDRQAEDAGLERGVSGRGHQEREGHGPLDGAGSGRITESTGGPQGPPVEHTTARRIATQAVGDRRSNAKESRKERGEGAHRG
jgi:hypothetical protein